MLLRPKYLGILQIGRTKNISSPFVCFMNQIIQILTKICSMNQTEALNILKCSPKQQSQGMYRHWNVYIEQIHEYQRLQISFLCYCFGSHYNVQALGGVNPHILVCFQRKKTLFHFIMQCQCLIASRGGWNNTLIIH